MKILIFSFCVQMFLCGYLVNGNTNSSTNLETLRQVHVIFRHGDRTPFMKAPIDPAVFDQSWTQGLSALTDGGKRRAFKLGQFLRERYDGFMGASYKPQEISVQTSDVDRTTMTGLTALAGMFPVTDGLSWHSEITWQPVPIRTIDSRVDNEYNNLLRFIGSTAPCPRWKQLKKEFFTLTDFAKRINSENQELYDYVQNNTGYPVNTFEDISDLFDTLTIQKSQGYHVPEWSKTVWEKMAALFPLPYDSRVLVPTQEAKRIRAGPLFSKIIQNLDTTANHLEGTGTVNMHWIVGHDWSVAGFLGALNMFETQSIAFTSAVIVELHEQTLPQFDASNYFIKHFYRKSSEVAPVEMEIPGCVHPCPLDQFKSIAQDFVLDDNKWAEACQ